MDGHEARITVALTVSQEKYLSTEERRQEMHAIVTVGVGGTDGAEPGRTLAEVLIIDCSRSMTWPSEKFRAAKDAAAAALRMLPDGTPFAVVQGAHTAAMAYPDQESMPRASAELRAAAERRVYGLIAAGGTSIGAWLDLARRLLAGQPAPIRHVLLLTDGKNEHDSQMPLAGVLDACDGQFVCDAWGIGDGWDAHELMGIAGRLHGRADAVHRESDLAAEYETLMRGMLGKAVPELVIKVTASPGSEVRYLKQVQPTEMDLARTGSDAGGRTVEFASRAWGNETRRYHLCISADSTGRPRNEDLQIAVIDIRLPGGLKARLPAPQPCLVHWTADPVLSQRVDGQVRHFQRHRELGEAIAKAADAFHHNRPDQAERHLGTAVMLAHLLGARRQLDQLQRLVDVLDGAAGRVRLRGGLANVDFQRLITGSAYTEYGSEPDGPGGPAASVPDAVEGATVPCPQCGGPSLITDTFCRTCGHRLAGES